MNTDKLLITDFAGLELSNPFLLAAGPPSRNAEMIMRAFEQGWAGAVTKTITLKPTRDVAPRLAFIHKSSVNIELISTDTPQRWKKWIGLIKQQYPANILVASIMGSTKANIWQRLAKQMADAGADALELNISCPHGMPERAMGSLIGQDPVLAGKVTAWVKKVSSIPVIVKLTPNVTDIGLIARACAESGADALAGINTVRALAGINIDTFEPLPSVGGRSAFGGYGGSAVKPIALRCVAEMVQAAKVPVSGGGGIFHWPDAVEFFLAGAGMLQVCTAVMLNGYGIIHHLKHGLKHYLVSKGFDSVNRIIGLAQRRIVKHSSLKSRRPDARSPVRALRLRKYVAIDPNKCLIDCRRCLVACRDAGFQAIAVKKNRCTVIRSRCDGCGLCVYVCPAKAVASPPDVHRGAKAIK